MLFAIKKLPNYTINDSKALSHNSKIQSIIIFILAFFSIYIVTFSRQTGSITFLPEILIISFIAIALYCLYLLISKNSFKLSAWLNTSIIYRGMLLNFIFLFCTFYLVLLKGLGSLYYVYFIYFISILLGPILKNIFLVVLGLLFLFHPFTFLLGVLLLCLFVTFNNSYLNDTIYYHSSLTRDSRILTKYRLSMMGSIVQ